ncbi:hypothetical protein [Methylorubrum aminovorans]|uniref:hypothetical protein n=1 Tax=Methylorubrum aminovorans TaxID=269069 RepID=UPI003C2ECA24
MPRSQSRPPHPGRTPAERRALDAIGCGDTLPAMHPKVRRNLLDAGLIEQTGTTARRDALGPYEVPQYEMPIPVHMQWCSAVAATDEEMAEFEAATPPAA